MTDYMFPYAGQQRRRPALVVIAPAPVVEKPTATLPPMPPSLKTILMEVCDKHGVDALDVVGKSHRQALVCARREFVWRCRQETAWSFTRIAGAINRDHTTAVHAYHSVLKGEAALVVYVEKPKDRLFPRAIEAAKLFNAGIGIEEIAKRFGVRKSTVASYLSKVSKHGAG